MSTVKAVFIDEAFKSVENDILKNTAGDFLLFAKTYSLGLRWLHDNQIDHKSVRIFTQPEQARGYKNTPVYILNCYDLSADLIQAAETINWPVLVNYVYTY